MNEFLSQMGYIILFVTSEISLVLLAEIIIFCIVTPFHFLSKNDTKSGSLFFLTVIERIKNLINVMITTVCITFPASLILKVAGNTEMDFTNRNFTWFVIIFLLMILVNIADRRFQKRYIQTISIPITEEVISKLMEVVSEEDNSEKK